MIPYHTANVSELSPALKVRHFNVCVYIKGAFSRYMARNSPVWDRVWLGLVFQIVQFSHFKIRSSELLLIRYSHHYARVITLAALDDSLRSTELQTRQGLSRPVDFP